MTRSSLVNYPNHCLLQGRERVVKNFILWIGIFLVHSSFSVSLAYLPEQLTTHPSLDYQASVSRDAQSLAFVSNRSGNSDIWLKSLNRSTISLPRQVTNHPANDHNPSLSRDGTRLLYVSQKIDPRGDIYLLDLITGEEQRLTDLRSADTFPQWDLEEEGFFYLKAHPLEQTPALYRKSLVTLEEKQVIGQANSFTVNSQGQVIFSNGVYLALWNPPNQPTPYSIPVDSSLSLWPSVDPFGTSSQSPPFLFFSHYDRDTNKDGVLDTDDESSIWLKRVPRQGVGSSSLFRLTPTRNFHAYPQVRGEYLYYSDLRAGDLFRIHVPSFLEDYEDLDRAQNLVSLFQDTQRPDLALLVLTNISNNLLGQLSPHQRAEFDFSLAELLAEDGDFLSAQHTISPHIEQGGRIGALSKIRQIVLRVQKDSQNTSPAERYRLVQKGVGELAELGRTHRTQPEVYGNTLLGMGRLYLLGQDPLTALDMLLKVDTVGSLDLKAKALFMRGEAYQVLGDHHKVVPVFIDVINMFGEQTSWGKRAIHQAIAFSQSGQESIEDKLISLKSLISQYPNLPVLGASVRLQLADLNFDQGEQLTALETLNTLLSTPDLPKALLLEAYQKKASILSHSERYQEAAETYAALSKLTGGNKMKVQETQNLLVLQLVKRALKNRKIGETRIAAKSLKHLITEYPRSVEAHRAYIETKSLLKEASSVYSWYTAMTERHPTHAEYQYGQALALSYLDPLDLPKVIRLLQQTREKDPSISYVHQTLGWAYEQFERISGEKGYLEKAEEEYRIALTLNNANRFPDVESQLLLNLGNTYLALSNFREAYRHYRQREELFSPQEENPTELIYRKNYGEACFKSGRSQEAIVQYERSLRQLPSEQQGLKAELLERIGLAHQDLGQYAQALEKFSQALGINQELQQTHNITLLQRNIGINLFNLSQSKEESGRPELKQALESYFSSLERLRNIGKDIPTDGPGLVKLSVALTETGSQAATGFDETGEEKLMFSYIASTYEQLHEPGPALQFYEKKLLLIDQSGSDPSSSAILTEKAIVLNRLGVLSHRLNQPQKSLDYFRQSLNYTLTLNLPFGTSVNAYNLSKIAVTLALKGQPSKPNLIETLISCLQYLQQHAYQDRHLFYTLTNTAWLLTQNAPPALDSHLTLKEAVQQSHWQMTVQTLSWSYYQHALQLLQNQDIFPKGHLGPEELMVKLNQAELARSGDQVPLYQTLQKDLNNLVEQEQAADGWLWYLAQAENQSNLDEQFLFVKQAIQAFLRFPPQTEVSSPPFTTQPAFERLLELAIDHFARVGTPREGFIVSERLAMHQTAKTLAFNMEEDFFLSGLGTYTPELKAIFSEIREAKATRNLKKLGDLNLSLQETLMALNEEFPWASASFSPFPPTPEQFFQTLDSQHPYLKIIKGSKQYYGFIHDGEGLLFSPLMYKKGEIQGHSDFHESLAKSKSAYVSLPPELESVLSSLGLSTKPLTWVKTCYDFINGFHKRSLFFANVTSPKSLHSTVPVNVGEVPMEYHQFSGQRQTDSHLAAQTDIAVFLGAPERLAFVVQKDREVREFVSVADFAGRTHHSAILLGGRAKGSPPTSVLISALLRAGFSHVILSDRPVNLSSAKTFVSQYLSYLPTHSPDEAVFLAAQEISTPNRIRHFGFAGMGPEERKEYASIWYEEEVGQALEAFETQDFPKSLGHIEHALALINHADQRRDFAELVTLAVETAFEVNNYRKGIFYQQKLLDSFDSETPDYERADALFRLGILQSRLEQFDQAVANLEEATRLWEEHEELDRLAESRSTLGIVQENRGAYTEALEEFHQSFSLYQELGELGQTAFQYRRIGRIYYLRLGRYENARTNFLEAQRLYQEQEDLFGETEVLYEIGLTYEKVGLFDQAQEYYLSGLALAESLEIPGLQATGHLYLANVAWFRGNYQKAFQALLQAKNQAEQADDPQLLIMITNTRGLVYWTLNDTEKGLRNLTDAVKLSEAADIPTELASSLNNLGLLYRQQGNHHAALDAFQRAMAIDESLDSQWGLGYDHRNIGITLLALNQYQEAETHLLIAEETSAQIHNITNWVKTLLELGNVKQALGQPKQASEYFQRAYKISKRHGIKEVEWRAAAGKANLLREEGKLSDALAWFIKGVDVVEGMRATLKIEELRNSFQSNKLDLYRDVVSLFIRLNRSEEAFNYLERSRARSFIDLLGNQKLSFKSHGDQETWTQIQKMASELDGLRKELGAYEQPPPNLQEQYQRKQTEYEELLLEVKQSNPELGSFVTVNPSNLEEIKDLLEPHTGLLSYFITEKTLFVWVIKKDQTHFHAVPISERKLHDLVIRYRQLVQHLEPVEEELQALYSLLIQPIEPFLAKIRYLGIIPDGPLHFLSFAALKHGPAYLVDEFPLFYAPSASVLEFTFAKRKTKKTDKVLAIGNPDLGSFNYDLPLAELEAQSIKWNYPQMDILTGPNATKEWVVNNISNYGIIHLAAHGEFDDFNPLLSSLWLASPNPENRRLTVQEVFGLNLNADLVTLSACQTGLGKLEAGELIGLNRAFMYAGTHALVSALWRVDDLSTSVLMKHFYRNYVESDKATSLRKAQLIVKKDFPHPSYWAGFSLVGDFQ